MRGPEESGGMSHRPRGAGWTCTANHGVLARAPHWSGRPVHITRQLPACLLTVETGTQGCTIYLRLHGWYAEGDTAAGHFGDTSL